MQSNGRIAHAVTADDASRDLLFVSLYTQLHQIAQSALRRVGPRLTLSPTTLLHEAYLNISRRDSVRFSDRSRFMAYASRAMRGLIIGYIRTRRAQKRGALFEIVSMPTEAPELAADATVLQRIGDALDDLERIDAALAELVDLKFFCGFSFDDIAGMRSTSERTVRRDWTKARLYLCESLHEEWRDGVLRSAGLTE